MSVVIRERPSTVCKGRLHRYVRGNRVIARVLKAFSEGRRRIVALAERKARARPGERIVLTVDDFDPRK